MDEPGGIEFNLPLSKWFRFFDDTVFVTAEWAHRYPSEQVWVVRKR